MNDMSINSGMGNEMFSQVSNQTQELSSESSESIGKTADSAEESGPKTVGVFTLAEENKLPEEEKSQGGKNIFPNVSTEDLLMSMMQGAAGGETGSTGLSAEGGASAGGGVA